MRAILLTSVLVATIAIPALAARDPDPRRALRHVVEWGLGFEIFYLFACRFIFERLP